MPSVTGHLDGVGLLGGPRGRLGAQALRGPGRSRVGRPDVGVHDSRLAGGHPPAHRRLVEEHLLDPGKFWLPVPPPSVAASDARFSRRDRFLGLRRYWRGPTWLNAAWLLWLGLVRLGYTDAAREMAHRLAATVAREGLREYYDPYTGTGMGARDFSWSALVMEMIDPDPAARSSHLADDSRRSKTG